MLLAALAAGSGALWVVGPMLRAFPSSRSLSPSRRGGVVCPSSPRASARDLLALAAALGSMATGTLAALLPASTLPSADPYDALHWVGGRRSCSRVRCWRSPTQWRVRKVGSDGSHIWQRGLVCSPMELLKESSITIGSRSPGMAGLGSWLQPCPGSGRGWRRSIQRRCGHGWRSRWSRRRRPPSLSPRCSPPRAKSASC